MAVELNIRHVNVEERAPGYNVGQMVGLALGPVLFLSLYLFLKPAGLGPEGVAALAATAWVAVWWVTEALPIPITSLLPIVLFPALGLGSVRDVLAPYADPTIFLFLGGFVIALAIERWNLHRRIALGVISRVGTNSTRLVLGFMLATGGLSAFLSNSATAMMMLPIGMAVIKQIAELQCTLGPDGEVPRTNFARVIMLGIAYAASIGGVGSIIGSPPNAVMVGVASKTLGVQITFLEYMYVGVPFALVILFVAWRILLRVFPPEFRELDGGREFVRKQLADLGPMTEQEWKVLAVFGLTALLWIIYPFLLQDVIPGISDTTVAMFGAILLFLIPSGRCRGEFLLDEKAFAKLPWGVLLLFGAGFCVASVFQSSGVAEWLSGFLTGLGGVHYLLIVLAVSIMLEVLTEITSNTAVATIFMPILVSLADALNISPVGLMMVAALSASMAFMMPVATPPNAIVFSTGCVTIRQMMKAGFFLNVASIITITLFGCFWIPLVWGK
ncbi:sodium-dependent dicarboxylate transporter 2/3/5 [Symbiobacterium terraclitae]|uniref:Sodium-dependent dicarboxylate transporter SdcS n=1 Tax=Symbiobacterium terraclitae TaxID=557451 RepID=A0ABS4JR20_9FIRM|nr:DASS family sodium-coupled anion symporter [Symbiobacterium terraclitae]MBP2017975.1 sodium-dependent dicarboxylate transporter 2/3/5 [Symbiobacterium terraclitae]